MNFFYQVKESVIDFKFYPKIKDNKFAKTFLYMLLLLFIVYSVITARNFLLVKNVMEQASYELNASMPNFELKDGKFSFEGEMPYYIANSGNEVFVIDTTNTVDESIIKNTITGILVTEDRIFVKNNLQQQTFEFSDLQSTEFNKQDLIEFLPRISWLALASMLLWFLFVVIGHMLFALLIVLIGFIISSAYNVDLKFKHLFNFSVYALTLPMLIDLALDLAGSPIRMFLFIIIYTAIASIYMLFAIKTYKDSLISPNEEEGHLL